MGPNDGNKNGVNYEGISAASDPGRLENWLNSQLNSNSGETWRNYYAIADVRALIANVQTHTLTQAQIQKAQQEIDNALDFDNYEGADIDYTSPAWAPAVSVGQVARVDANQANVEVPGPSLVNNLLQVGMAVALDAAGVGEVAYEQQMKGILGLASNVYDALGNNPNVGNMLTYYAPLPSGGGQSMSQQQLAGILQSLANVSGQVSALSPTPGMTFAPTVGDAEISAAMNTLSWVGRCAENPNFLIIIGGGAAGPDPTQPFSGVELANAGPFANNPGESDYAMLNRTVPTYFWVPGGVNGGVQYGYPIVPPAEYRVSAYYAPLLSGGPGSDSLLSQFYALWNYAPAAGPAPQNGIANFKYMMALIPIQY